MVSNCFAPKFPTICSILLCWLLPIAANALVLAPERSTVAPGEEVRVQIAGGRASAEPIWRHSQHLEMLGKEFGAARFLAREEGRALVTVTVDGQLASVFIEVSGKAAADPSPATTQGQTAEPEEPVAPVKQESPDSVLFDGRMSSQWIEESVSGGDFAQFARFDNGALVVDVPDGHAWAKTGLRSPEPLVFPGDGGDATLLRFAFDPARTSSFVIAFAVSDAAEEWEAHEIRLAWSRSPEADSGTAGLYLSRKVIRVLTTGPDAPGTIEIRLDPSGVVEVAFPDGQVLEADLPRGLAADGYHIHVIAHAPGHNKAAQMTLKRIKREAIAARPVLLKPYPDTRAEVVLFDGRLGTLWTPHSAAGGDFTRDARIDGQALVVNVAEGSSWAKVGLLSDQVPLWLDAFHGEAEAEITFEIDPEGTNGFVLALARSGWGGVPGNDPGKPNALFFWRHSEGAEQARADFHVNPHPEGDFWSAETAPQAPRTVRFILRPGEITVAPEGMEPVTRPWDHVVDGAGFHIYAYSHAPEANAATGFKLTSIRIRRLPGAQTVAQGPAPGVEPLPTNVIFDGQPSDAWEPIGVAGGNFEAFARFDDGKLVVDVPEKSSWGKTGILSATPVLRLDERVWTTPTRIELTLDPARPQNLNLALSGAKIADMWNDHQAWIWLIYVPETDRWALGLRTSPYNSWGREIDGGWMRENWDGRLWVDIGHKWGAVEVPGGPRLWAGMNADRGLAAYLVAQAHPPQESDAAQLDLRQISVGLLTPEGMTAVERWRLLDVAQFNPQGFLEDLTASMGWPAAGEVQK